MEECDLGVTAGVPLPVASGGCGCFGHKAAEAEEASTSEPGKSDTQ